MFAPEEVIFAPTGQCNLTCGHCRVSRPQARLDPALAVAFLADCKGQGIEQVGFSGGEPFLEVDFLVTVAGAAVKEGFLFDRLMTNGVWFKEEGELRSALLRLEAAGFDGHFGLSVDAWHRQDPDKLVLFAKTVFDIWGRRDILDILSVRHRDEGPWLAKLEALAEGLGGEIEVEEGEALAIVDSAFDDRLGAGEDVPEALSIDLFRFPYSPSAAEGAWGADSWFEDDYCEGPGNVLYVHPTGDVAACCGFANEAESLRLGRMGEDSVASMLERAQANPHVRACYKEGLGRLRVDLQAKGFAFPGITDDQCFFCDWLCARGLIPGVAPLAKGR